MIHELGVRVVGRLGVAYRNRFLVAIVEPDVGFGARSNIGDCDPDQAFRQQRVIALDMELQRRLVVARHEAQIAAIVLGGGEAEVTGMQPYQHRRRADRIGDVGSGRAGVDGDLLA